ncbi:MAG TPA: DoxX family protein [Terriglobales bacterium]|nr:DoxX family protein [Terriglobales bacterium]
MQPAEQSIAVSKGALWAGRIISGLAVVFLLFDSISKLLRMASVMAAAAQMGFNARQIVAIGVVLLICLILYVIPRTSMLGAILLTGYLGGATATNVHEHGSVALVLFPVVFGVLVWSGLYLRDRQLRTWVPLRAR